MGYNILNYFIKEQEVFRIIIYTNTHIKIKTYINLF